MRGNLAEAFFTNGIHAKLRRSSWDDKSVYIHSVFITRKACDLGITSNGEIHWGSGQKYVPTYDDIMATDWEKFDPWCLSLDEAISRYGDRGIQRKNDRHGNERGRTTYLTPEDIKANDWGPIE